MNGGGSIGPVAMVKTDNQNLLRVIFLKTKLLTPSGEAKNSAWHPEKGMNKSGFQKLKIF